MDVTEAVMSLRRDGQLVRHSPADFEIGYRHVALRANETSKPEPEPGAEGAPTLHASRLTPHSHALDEPIAGSTQA